MRRLRGILTRLTAVLLAGAAVALAGPGTAHASTTVEIPAATPNGISATVRFHGAKVPQPYNPDPNAAFGDRKCQLIYHDYEPTPGCGGFKLDVVLHNVRNQPGYQAGLDSTWAFFQAYADTERTFGCLSADGTFDHRTAFVVRTEQAPLSHTYYTTSSSYILQYLRSNPGQETGPYFFVNFPAVQVDCPAGTTPTQYGLKVTNVKVTIDEANVFGTTTWSTPGPFYA
ncbi:hypothetical protein [Streptomyces cavernae]|uniref:hypothetical protein n=1 Tax=Streptomyces cavernae TaxID=2259034 RepID=UPI000FEB86C7|nr:hypothetical protein [Streptomyces cavernae]